MGAHPRSVLLGMAVFQAMWVACTLGIEIEVPYSEGATDNGEPLVPSIDWEALIQSTVGKKLSVAGNAGIDNDLQVGGEATLSNTLHTHGKATFEKDVEVRGKTLNHGGQEFVLGTLDGTNQMSKRNNRALYHHSSPADSLHVNFDGDFEGGVVVGGPTTLVEGALVSNGLLTANKDMVVMGSNLHIGKGDGKSQGSVDTNRALAHADKDILIVNQEGDFEGGVHVQGKGAFYDGKVAIGKDHTEPLADLHFKTNEKEAMILFSHHTQSKNSVYVKALEATGGVNMEIGSTSGEKSFGNLIVNFGGDITFLGEGATVWKRGPTVFSQGVGFGANAGGGKAGITVQSDQKPGDESNDIHVKQGSVQFFGKLEDISTKGDKGDYYLDFDEGGHMNALNLNSKLGIGTKVPKSDFADTEKALIHMVDAARPVITLESKVDTGHSTIVMKTGSHAWQIDQAGKFLKLGYASKEMLVLDSDGKLGIGRPNNEPYGVNLHIGEGVDNPLNDLAIPHGHLRLKGKIFDTFDGGDNFYLDPSQSSNINDLGVEGKLSFKGVDGPAIYHLEVPKGNAHISLGRSLFLNGFGGESARVTNNAIVDKDGKWKLHDGSKQASAIELRNDGTMEFLATQTPGKDDWQMLLGMNGPKKSVYAFGNFGLNIKEPKHSFEMAGGESTMALGDNLFLQGSGDTSRIVANAYIKDKEWQIDKKDRFASVIELRSSGGIDMYGTEAQGTTQWKKMFGFHAPSNHLYALGNLGIQTEKPTHTLTLPSGEHHISLGDKLFLNGQGVKTRVMGNCFLKAGQVNVKDKNRHGIAIEMDSGAGQLNFGGSQSTGEDKLLQLFTVNFVKKVVAVPGTGRLGLRTSEPKTTLDVHGHVNLQDPSNAGVIYTPEDGPGLFIRSSNAPGRYQADHDRYFFGNNKKVGFGTVQPAAKLHIVQSEQGVEPHLKLENTLIKPAGLHVDLTLDKDGLLMQSSVDGLGFRFKSGEGSHLSMYGTADEGSENGIQYRNTVFHMVPDGGRAVVGKGKAQGQHNLQVLGQGIMIQGSNSENTGVLAFANDGGGMGFQLDYTGGIMRFGSLPPMAHLKINKRPSVHLAVLDNGRIGVGTEKPSAAFTVKSDTGIAIENAEGTSWTMSTSKEGHIVFSSNKGGYFKVDENGGMHLTRKQSEYKLEVDGTGMMLNGGSSGKAPLDWAPDGGGKGFRMDYYKEKMQFGHRDGSKWHMVVTDDGLIGVGTPIPQTGVHVKHDSGIAIEHGTKAEKWTISTAEDATLKFAYKDAPHVMYTKDGKVGIALKDQETPTKTLHVNGDVFVAGKMHVDNYYLQKMAKKENPTLERLTSAEALIQLDEHVSAKMEDEGYGMVHRPDSKKAAEPVDHTSLMAVMHKMVQDHQAQIKKLEERIAVLEARQ